MINFVKPKSEESPVLVKWRRLVKMITTVVVVAWVVASAGVLGWWVFVKAKTVAVSTELQSLLIQTAAKSEEEILVRKLDLRSKAVNDFLANRGDILQKLDVLQQATPAASIWKFSRADDIQTVTLPVKNVAQVDDYLTVLKNKYTSVKLESLVKTDATGWTAEISMGGLQK